MTTSLTDWPSDAPIPLSHPEIPPAILAAVMEMYEPDDDLHRVTTDIGIEWWLLDWSGELKEAFWLEK